MISSIVFINQKGEILIYRIFKDDIARQEIVQFCAQKIATKENKEFPIVNINSTSFIHIQQKDIIILAATKQNVNAAMTIQFLYQIVNICKAYFGQELDENNIKKYFVLIYELLDEIMDFGVPQMTDPMLLKKFIQEGGMKLELQNDIQKLRQLTTQATGATSWRPDNLKYLKNEVYLDVIESVNVLLSSKGTILKNDVQGVVKIKAQLSGMPECKFGMNDKLLMAQEQKNSGTQSKSKGITIDDIKFHQCVKLGKFNKERAITFIPPDGAFELMTYRITENVNLPFKIVPIIDEDSSYRIVARIKLKSIFDRQLYATNIVLKLPTPKNISNQKFITSVGKAKYEPDQGGIIWRIKKFQGDMEGSMQAELQIYQADQSKKSVWNKNPISMQFQVPMFPASGLRVRYLRVYEKSGYKPIKWIRYITKAGDYQHRIQ